MNDTIMDQSLASTEVPQSVEELRAALEERNHRLAQLTERSEALACAQADAIVHSAEIIDELERTKQHLSDARAAAETAAQDTKRLADTIFERTHDAVVVLKERICVACNDNARKSLGYERDELIGKWPHAFEYARDEQGECVAGTVRDRYNATVNNSFAPITEALLKRPDGSDFWAEITMSGFGMEGGNHVLAVIRDISHRKQFEADLRRHRDFLDNIINAIPDQLSVKSADRKLVLANDEFCIAHGVRRESIVGQVTSQQLPAYLDIAVEEIESQLDANGRIEASQHEVVGGDGASRAVSVRRSMFEDQTSAEKYVITTTRDITEDRVREERLRILASVFKGASEGVAILKQDGRICEANPAFLQMAFSPETIGVSLADVLQFDELNSEHIFRKVAGGDTWAGKAAVRSTGSGLRSYWVSLSPSTESDCSSRIIALVSDITELEATQDKLRRQAYHDNLTGLPNRRFFRDRVQQLIQESSAFAVCFLDLDDFKHVNDSSGHKAGDRLLQYVGRRLQSVVGQGTFVARFGGDEFAIILTGEQAGREMQAEILDRLLTDFRVPFKLREVEAVVGLSIGSTSFPDHAQDADALMGNADIAMYAAKTAGKNRVRYFNRQMQDIVDKRHRVETQLRRALSDREIILWFQPKVCAKTLRSRGCEALARWQLPDGNFVPPGEFIPIAEQTGLILPLGLHVFELAARQAVDWYAAGDQPLIALNISPIQLRHPRFVEQIRSILTATGAKAEWLELEITEHAMMDDITNATTVIEQLSDMGFRIAIDDFGTGYSSLSYLKHFEIDTLKIDLSFVRDLLIDRQSSAVVRSIISLGNGLNLTVVAEGVECGEQAAALAEAGCTLLQGYHIAKPMPAKGYQQWSTSRRTIL